MIKEAIVSIVREACTKILTLAHNVIDHAYNSPDNNELDEFTKRDTIISVMAVVLSGCRISKDQHHSNGAKKSGCDSLGGRGEDNCPPCPYGRYGPAHVQILSVYGQWY